jgi:hypothetical protein
MAKKQQATAQAFDIGSKLRNIQTLVATQRSKEAIAYMYMLYTMLCRAKYKEVKTPSQSIRDYAMIMVKKHGMNPSNIYPFVTQVESIIYGGRQPTEENFRQTVDVFGKVFEEVVGKPLPAI